MSKLAHSNQETMDQIEADARAREERGERDDPPEPTEQAELARKCALFAAGTKRIYDDQGARADMWYFELWHHLNACSDALRNADSRLQAQAWQPIETAPKTGIPFLAVVPSSYSEARQVRIVQWGKTSHIPLYGFCLADQGVEDFDICEPTHWMYLPAPPSVQTPD